MKSPFPFIFLILSCLIISSCQKEFSDPNVRLPHVYDADALRFIDSTGISDTTQRFAIDEFVRQLKDSSLWSKFMAIYPMVGGSASSAKWNLKDPIDLDSAYRLTFNGSPVFAPTGVLFPAVSDYADTHLMDSTLSGSNNNTIAYYSRTQNTISGYDMGCSDSKNPWNEFSIYHGSDATNWFGFFALGIQPASTVGLFMLSCTPGDVKRYDNGLVTDAKGSAPTPTFTNLPILIGSVANAPSGGQRECGLATIGNGLTDAQALTFYNIVQNFETALGR